MKEKGYSSRDSVAYKVSERFASRNEAAPVLPFRFFAEDMLFVPTLQD